MQDKLICSKCFPVPSVLLTVLHASMCFCVWVNSFHVCFQYSVQDDVHVATVGSSADHCDEAQLHMQQAVVMERLNLPRWIHIHLFLFAYFSYLLHCWLGCRKGIRPVKMGDGGGGHYALVSPDRVAPSRMVSVSASVNLPFHHKVQKFSSGTGSPGWSRKKGCKTVVMVIYVNGNGNIR